MSFVDNLSDFLLCIMHMVMRNLSAIYVRFYAQHHNVVLCIFKYAQLKIGVMGNNGMWVMGNPWGECVFHCFDCFGTPGEISEFSYIDRFSVEKDNFILKKSFYI